MSKPHSFADDAASYQDDGWWREHFSGDMAELWRLIVPPQRAAEDADFLVQHLDLCRGTGRPLQVLDLPCGEGRVAVELAARGYALTGLDISAALLALAAQRAAERDVQVQWLQGDMRALASISGSRRYDAIFCWGDSFGYLDEVGNGDFLRCVRDALAPGGRFALEVQMLAELLAPRFAPQAQGRAGPFQVNIQRHWNRAQGRLNVRYHLQRDAGGSGPAASPPALRLASYRIHTLAELQVRLAQAGLHAQHWLGRDGAPFRAEAVQDDPFACLRVVCTAAN